MKFSPYRSFFDQCEKGGFDMGSPVADEKGNRGRGFAVRGHDGDDGSDRSRRADDISGCPATGVIGRHHLCDDEGDVGIAAAVFPLACSGVETVVVDGFQDTVHNGE